MIQDPLGVVYAPAHHNFDWEYAMDLYKAVNLSASNPTTPSPRSIFESKGVRYLVISKKRNSDSHSFEAYLLSDKGVKTELGPVELK